VNQVYCPKPLWTASNNRGNTFTMISPLRERSWQLAGMEEEVTGLLGSMPISSDVYTVPAEIWLEGDVLRWDDESLRIPEPPVGMLDAFVRLEDANDVLRFARKWGVFRFCLHGLPMSHTEIRRSPLESGRFELDYSGPCWTEEMGRQGQEQVNDYLRYVSAARSLLNLAASILQGHVGEPPDWEAALRPFVGPDWFEGGPYAPAHPETARWEVGDAVSEWIRIGAVQPRLVWFTETPRFATLSGSFGILGMQLLSAVTRAHGIATCSNCGIPYIRRGRRPQAGRRNYCGDCGPRAWLRDAQRDYRRRKRSDGPQS
jgi:hypothetical protein